tara:strand:+ start:145498 stop:145698 length:201 start_codon:yes stop_codon:yes gene_type:complete
MVTIDISEKGSTSKISSRGTDVLLKEQEQWKRLALSFRNKLKNVKTVLIPTSSLRHIAGYGQERVD